MTFLILDRYSMPTLQDYPQSGYEAEAKDTDDRHPGDA
jgi:hypothetical protein